jgi:hypothetical protein
MMNAAARHTLHASREYRAASFKPLYSFFRFLLSAVFVFRLAA